MTSREVRDVGQCDHRWRSRVRVRPVSSAKLATAISEEDHAQGPADAAITLVQYGNYECPYTRLSRHSVQQLQREFSDSLRFVFRHFPLEVDKIHPHARAAAAAAEAAARQTDFWTMHAYLFEHQQALEERAHAHSRHA